jgi:hypothetical protein
LDYTDDVKRSNVARGDLPLCHLELSPAYKPKTRQTNKKAIPHTYGGLCLI